MNVFHINTVVSKPIILLGILLVLVVSGCQKKEPIGTDTEPKVIKSKNKVKSKKEEISLSIEEVNYGARYCLSVAQQMRYDKPHNICTGFDILLDKAEAYSKISLDSENVDEAYEYFKIFRKFLI